jgi:TolB-like protein/DNA-binding winged helix-turn-helix (wHTH) protein
MFSMIRHESTRPEVGPEARGYPFLYRFGVVEVDFQAGELRNAGVRIKIQDQPLHALSILLRRPGEIVTREEFRQQLWPADTFVDFEHGLNSTLKRLRHALNDDPAHPHLIETLPRHGYRFIAPVTKIAAPPATAWEPVVAYDFTEGDQASQETKHAESEPPHSSRPSPSRRDVWMIATVTGFLMIAISIAALYVRSTQASPTSNHPPVTLAVLPFRDLSPVPTRSFLAEGMTQELITCLGKLAPGQIAVSAIPFAEPHKPSDKSAFAIGRELGVQYVLAGSTRLQNDHLRISVQLIKVSDQSYVWAESYDEIADDVLHAQGVAASQISAEVHQELTRSR